MMIMAISFGLGLGVQVVPAFLSKMPEIIQKVFGSPITVAGLAAIVSNIVLPRR